MPFISPLSEESPDQTGLQHKSSVLDTVIIDAVPFYFTEVHVKRGSIALKANVFVPHFCR